MTDSHFGASVPAAPTPTAEGILRRLPELDSCEPEQALARYQEISAALVAVLDGAGEPAPAVDESTGPSAATV